MYKNVILRLEVRASSLPFRRKMGYEVTLLEVIKCYFSVLLGFTKKLRNNFIKSSKC